MVSIESFNEYVLVYPRNVNSICNKLLQFAGNYLSSLCFFTVQHNYLIDTEAIENLVV